MPKADSDALDATPPGGRFWGFFAEAVEPYRVTVLNSAGACLGLGEVIVQNRLRGDIITYVVALADGTRVTVAPSQIFNHANVVRPIFPAWQPNADQAAIRNKPDGAA